MVKLDLPLPDTPVTQVKVPSGMEAVTLARLLARAPWTVSFLPLPLRRFFGTAISRRAGEVVGGERLLRFQHLLQRALRHHLAPAHARAGAEIDNMVRLPDGVLVMLHHDDRVAKVAQAFQRLQQAVVVALVQADAGFVEHVEHAR